MVIDESAVRILCDLSVIQMPTIKNSVLFPCTKYPMESTLYL